MLSRQWNVEYPKDLVKLQTFIVATNISLKPIQTHWKVSNVSETHSGPWKRPTVTNQDTMKFVQRHWNPFNKCGWDLMVWMGFRGCEHVWVGLDRFQLVLTGFSGSGCFQSCYMGFSGYESFSVGPNGLEIGVDWSGFRGCGSASIGMHGI